MSGLASAKGNNENDCNYSYSHWRSSEFTYRRRRKTREPAPTSSARKHYLSSYFCDDSTLGSPSAARFGDTITAAKTSKRRYSDATKPYFFRGEVSMALPSLLYHREIGVLSSGGCRFNTSLLPPFFGLTGDDSGAPHVNFHRSRKMFSALVLQTSRDHPIMRRKKKSYSQTMIGIEQLHQIVFRNSFKPCWRPYAERTILFSHLKTSPCDAVLGITYDGSILVAIGPSNKCNEGSRNVVLRFYGIPSPHVLQSAVQKRKDLEGILSPVLCSIPFARISSRENFDLYEDGNGSKVDIVLASNIGIALITPQESEDNENVGNLFIFTIPYSLPAYSGNGKTTAFVLQSSGVTIKAAKLEAMKDVLWPTTFIPVPPISFQTGALETLEFDGYILFNDEADGYRLCWIQLLGDSQGRIGANLHHSKTNQSSRLTYKAGTSIISLPVLDVDWEPIINHFHDNLNCNCLGSLTVKLMAYLHVDALLSDVLSRRLSSFTTRQLPNFSYSLISVESGRTVELVIVFQNDYTSLELEKGYNPPSLGVIVRLDLVTLSYEELSWTSLDTELCDETLLSKWSASLSAIFRAACFSRSGNILAQDWHCMGRYNDHRSRYASFCDHFSNEAVLDMKPLRSLQSSASPVTLNYG